VVIFTFRALSDTWQRVVNANIDQDDITPRNVAFHIELPRIKGS